jgi:hypothetical protein
MSTYVIEKVLWDFGNQPDRIARFKADPDRYLAEYDLTPDEMNLIKQVDVRGMYDRNVHPLLSLLHFILMNGPSAQPEYARLMNLPRT